MSGNPTHYSLETYERAVERQREAQEAALRRKQEIINTHGQPIDPMLQVMLQNRYSWPHEDHPMNYQFNAIGMPMIKLKDDEDVST